MDMFKKNPRERPSITALRVHPWINAFDLGALPTEDENTLVDINVTDEEVKASMTEIVPAELVCFLCESLSPVMLVDCAAAAEQEEKHTLSGANQFWGRGLAAAPGVVHGQA
jgi:hypothetical protein